MITLAIHLIYQFDFCMYDSSSAVFELNGCVPSEEDNIRFPWVELYWISYDQIVMTEHQLNDLFLVRLSTISPYIYIKTCDYSIHQLTH